MCGKKPELKPEESLSIADLTRRVTLKEDSRDVLVIRIKAKAFIKHNDIRSAKAKAMETANAQAVDVMVRGLLPEEDYNNNYENIDKYLSSNVQKYIVSSEVNDEKISLAENIMVLILRTRSTDRRS